MSKRALGGSAQNGSDSIDWELRPGGMLVQLRDPNAETLTGPKIKLKVSYGLSVHEVSIVPHASFGDLKKILAPETGLQPKDQRLHFRGKERDSNHYLHVVGVKDKSKIILVEDPISRERRLQETRRNEQIGRACKAIANVKQEVDKLAEQISMLDGIIRSGSTVAENELETITEMLMCHLLKLDGIKADGEAKVQRRVQVRRVQKYVETIDGLKARIATRNSISSTVVTTNWETFDSGMGSLSAPPPSTSSTIMTNWERFD
eukprot:c43433_g1_i1 orf=652-1437(+)